MNKIFITIYFFFSLLAINSQNCFEASKANWGNDSLECRKNVSLYSEFMKQKVFVDAAKFWNKTQKFCPQYKPNLYKNGIYIYKQIAKEKKKAKELPGATEPEITRMEFDMKDQMIRNTIMTTQKDVEEIKVTLEKIEDKLYNR